MRRPLIHLLLLLTLIGNVLIAPLHAWIGSPASVDSVATSTRADGHADCTEHVASDPSRTDLSTTDPSNPKLPAEEACCEGPDCDCGCWMMPALRISGVLLLNWSAVLSPDPARPVQLRVQHGSAPLRPPAV